MKKLTNLTLDVLLWGCMLFLMFPLFVLIIWSITKIWPWPYLLPREFGLRGILSLLNPYENAFRVLIFSVFLSLTVTIITLLISIPAAKALALYEFRGKNFIKIAILAPIIVPTICVAMGIHVAFIRIGLANTFLGVVLVHIIPCLPYGVRILTNVFEIVGEKMELQAKVLGANRVQRFIYITFPMITPGLITAGSLIFIISFSQYFLTFLIGGGQVMTFPMLMFPFIQSGDRMMASGYSIVFILTTLLFLTIIERWLKSYYKIENHFYI